MDLSLVGARSRLAVASSFFELGSNPSQSFSLSYQRSGILPWTPPNHTQSCWNYLQKTIFSRFIFLSRKRNKAQEKKKLAWHEYNRALWEEPRPENIFSNVFFFSFRRFSFIIDALWPTFSFLFCSLPQPVLQPTEKAFAQGFTVNQSYVMKASFLCVSVLSIKKKIKPFQFASLCTLLCLKTPNFESSQLAVETVTCDCLKRD